MKDSFLKKSFHFIGRESVLVISWLLAGLSMCAIPPDGVYMSYIDFHTLSLLFGLMGVMAGLQSTGLFRRAGLWLLRFAKTKRQVEGVLILLCFFSSMVITNDVALITFVPFAFEVLLLAGLESGMIFVVTMQTIAANLGSMLLPVGNPQNIFLFTEAGCSAGRFILVMLPYCALSLCLLCVAILLRKNSTAILRIPQGTEPVYGRRGHIAVYAFLFLACLLAVFRVIPAAAAFFFVLIGIIACDARLLLRIDYSLLLTFVGFFLFVGNLGRIPAFSQALASLLEGREVLVSAGASQLISNVPAALLLSGFTTQWERLLVGVNIGGLGTLIASMASLISYKQIARRVPEKRAKYLLFFTGVNILFFLAMLATAYMTGAL